MTESNVNRPPAALGKSALPPTRGVAVRISGLSVHFGDVRAVDNVTLNIQPGELFFLLGPSGCGKTTLLRAIAGFADSARGEIHFDKRRIDRLPSNERGATMIFQNYALWPHLTVAENVAYGLEVRRVPAEAAEQQVQTMLAAVGLDEYASRRPGELSGGQQQRVALARALVVQPKVLLLDEPLSNLDAKLRGEMRREIRAIVRKTGVTAIYVTHDQREALSMADRLAVMVAGRIEQQGAPGTVYRYPQTPFVASFLGEANHFGGRIIRSDKNSLHVESPLGELTLPARGAPAPTSGSELPLFVRAEAVRLGQTKRKQVARFKATIGEAMFQGESAHFLLVVKGAQGEVLTLAAVQYNPRGEMLAEGRKVDAFVEMKDIGIIGAAPPEIEIAADED